MCENMPTANAKLHSKVFRCSLQERYYAN